MMTCDNDIDIYFGELVKTAAEFQLAKGEGNYDIGCINMR